jgi:hypothetical protein
MPTAGIPWRFLGPRCQSRKCWRRASQPTKAWGSPDPQSGSGVQFIIDFTSPSRDGVICEAAKRNPVTLRVIPTSPSHTPPAPAHTSHHQSPHCGMESSAAHRCGMKHIRPPHLQDSHSAPASAPFHENKPATDSPAPAFLHPAHAAPPLASKKRPDTAHSTPRSSDKVMILVSWLRRAP